MRRPLLERLAHLRKVGGLIVDSGHTPLWLSPRRDCFRPFPAAELLPALTSEHQQLDDAAEVVVSGGKPDLDQLGLAPNARLFCFRGLMSAVGLRPCDAPDRWPKHRTCLAHHGRGLLILRRSPTRSHPVGS